jgi:hypothetical protein
MHGPTVILEQILDWRPNDYFTYMTTMPGNGPVFPTMFEFEPTTTGTRVTMRVGKPKKKADLPVLAEMGKHWASAMEQGMSELRTLASAEANDLMKGRAEPPLPQLSNADNFLAGITPIQMLD